jgi:hypothetical protein
MRKKNGGVYWLKDLRKLVSVPFYAQYLRRGEMLSPVNREIQKKGIIFLPTMTNPSADGRPYGALTYSINAF